MKTRIKNKIEKRKNRNKHQEILSIISQNGFTLDNVYYLDGYFIFPFEKSAVCHFRLKELPNYLLAIWLNVDEEHKIQLFAEHYDYLDKFKPSAVNYLSYNVYEFIDMIKDIKHNYDYHYVSYTETLDRNDKQKIKEILDEIQEEKEKERENDYLDWKYTFDFFKSGIFNLIPELVSVGIKDENVGGADCSPRYRLTLEVTKDFYKQFDFVKNNIIDPVLNEMHNNRPINDTYMSKHKVYFLEIVCYPLNKKDYTYLYTKK